MRSNRAIIFTAFVIAIAFSLNASAQTENVLYTFVGGAKSGAEPSSGIVSDSAGNLYGVTTSGGAHNYGVVYELSEVLKGKQKGTWKFKILHSFTGGSKDGQGPVGNLVLDSSGNLYGVTQTGGSHGLGAAYELAKPVSGAWKETVLYNFGASGDGSLPQAGLILDSAGNLYGTASSGGQYANGTAFELVRQATAPWKESILHNFGSTDSDGAIPVAPLIMDKAGNLYGTTMAGGGASACSEIGVYGGCGTVFKLAKSGSAWTESVLYALQNNGYDDGNYPLAGVTLDANGNLYGTAYGNKSEDDGDTGWVFEVAYSGNNWTYDEVQYLGCYNGCPYGAYPKAGLTLDSAGNLWGATTIGGFYSYGVILEITPDSGTWTINVPFQFSGSIGGYNPAAAPLVTAKGQLLGTTLYGGDAQCNCGVVYEVTF
jgi:hypothetical protein